MIGGKTRRTSKKAGRRTRRAGSMLRKAALPALLTGLVLSSRKSKRRRSRRGKKSLRKPLRGGRVLSARALSPASV